MVQTLTLFFTLWPHASRPRVNERWLNNSPIVRHSLETVRPVRFKCRAFPTPFSHLMISSNCSVRNTRPGPTALATDGKSTFCWGLPYKRTSRLSWMKFRAT